MHTTSCGRGRSPPGEILYWVVGKHPFVWEAMRPRRGRAYVWVSPLVDETLLIECLTRWLLLVRFSIIWCESALLVSSKTKGSAVSASAQLRC